MLKKDLDFVKNHLEKDFRGFKKRFIKITESYQCVQQKEEGIQQYRKIHFR